MSEENGNKKIEPSKSKIKLDTEPVDCVQFDREKLLNWVLPIMKLLDAGHYPAQIAVALSMKPQHVHYYVKKLVGAGLFYQSKRSNTAYYDATGKVKDFSGHVRATFGRLRLIGWISVRWLFGLIGRVGILRWMILIIRLGLLRW